MQSYELFQARALIIAQQYLIEKMNEKINKLENESLNYNLQKEYESLKNSLGEYQHSPSQCVLCNCWGFYKFDQNYGCMCDTCFTKEKMDGRDYSVPNL